MPACKCLEENGEYRPVRTSRVGKDGYSGYTGFAAGNIQVSILVKDAGDHKFYIKIPEVSQRVIADHDWWFNRPANDLVRQVELIKEKYGKT